MNGESAFDVFRRLQVKPIAVGVPFWDPIPVGSSNSNSSNDQTSAHDTRKSGPAPASKPPPTTWLYPGEVLEVFGRPGAGKTEFLYQSALSVAMPKRFEGIELGGKVERGVMVIDLDYRFKLRRVQLLLEFRVTSVLAAQGHGTFPAYLPFFLVLEYYCYLGLLLLTLFVKVMLSETSLCVSIF